MLMCASCLYPITHKKVQVSFLFWIKIKETALKTNVFILLDTGNGFCGSKCHYVCITVWCVVLDLRNSSGHKRDVQSHLSWSSDLAKVKHNINVN